MSLHNNTLTIECCSRKISASPPFSFPFALRDALGLPHPFAPNAAESYSFLYDTEIVVSFELRPERSLTDSLLLEWNCIDGHFQYDIQGNKGVFAGGQRPFRLALKNQPRISGKLVFPPQYSYLRQRESGLNRKVEAVFDQRRVFSRAPSCYFGWDWAAAVFPFGIRSLPALRTNNGVFVRGSGFLHGQDAFNTLTLFLDADKSREVVLKVSVPPDCETIAMRSLSPGLNVVSVVLNGLSQATKWPQNKCSSRFELNVNIYDCENHLESYSAITSLRNVTHSAADFFPISVNSQPLRWGANFVEPFFLPHEAGADVSYVLRSAKNADFDILRVWGGGRYCSEEFLSECDRLGIAVWQDMPFACGSCPIELDEGEYRAELVDFLIRSAHHPSLVMICGGNENEWLYGAKRTECERDFFTRQVPEIISTLRPDLLYWPDSPWGEGKPNDPQTGDYHEWGFWSGKKPISVLCEQKPLFVSEFGFQSAPSVSVLRDHAGGKGDAELIKTRQFQHKGSEILEHYMRQFGGEALIAAEPVSASRYCQAMALATAIRCWRYNDSFKGALVWQLNDVMPAVSWSLVDVQGVPKPALSALRWAMASRSIAYYRDDKSQYIKLLGSQGKAQLLISCYSDGLVNRMNFELDEKQSNGSAPIELPSACNNAAFVRIEAYSNNSECVKWEWWNFGLELGGKAKHQIFLDEFNSPCIAVEGRSNAIVLIESKSPHFLSMENPITVLEGERRVVKLVAPKNASVAEAENALSVRIL